MTILTSRRLLIKAGATAAICPHIVFASDRDKQARTPRIGFLIGQYPPFIDAFNDELKKLGYVLGQNIIVETRLSRTNSNDLEAQAAELAAMDLDLIVAAALPQALAVRRHNPAMPMVIGTAPGIVTNGFAKSLERPGGIVTGMDELPPGLTAKRLRLLKMAAPETSRVALLSTTPGVGGHEIQLADAERAAQELGIVVKSYRATNLAELNAALAAIRADRANGLISFQGALALSNAKLVTSLAADMKMPAIYQSKLFIDAGGLMAYAPDQELQFRIAAQYVDQILKGAKPGDLPIRHPSQYYLTYNWAASSALKITPSEEFRALIDLAVGS